MRLLKTEQILWEKTCTRHLLLEIKLKPWPQKVMKVVPHVVALRHEWQENSIVAFADLYIEIYFSDKNAALNFMQYEERITEIFIPENVTEGMQVYVYCDAHVRDLNLTGDTLTTNLKMDFKFEGTVARSVTAQFQAEAITTQKITAFQSFGTKTCIGSSYGIFQKPDLWNISAIRSHVEQLDARLFNGLAVVEGSVALDIFYCDRDGVEKYEQMCIPIRESLEIESAQPQRQAKVHLDFSGVKHSIKNYGECEIVVAYKLEVKVLEKKERDVIVEINDPAYEITKKDLILNQNVCEGTITLMLEEKFNLPYSVKEVLEVYGSIDSITCRPDSTGFTASGVLGIELYCVCGDHCERCKYLEMEFRKSQALDDVTGEEIYELKGRVPNILAEPCDDGVIIKALVEIEYTGTVKQQLQAVTDVIPCEGIQKELFHIERCIDEKNISFMEKFEITTDFPIAHVENVKGDIENVELTIIDSKLLIQCNVGVLVIYVGDDGVLYSKKALFPFGLFEDLDDSGPQMQVKVKPKIGTVKTELVTSQKLTTLFDINFDLLVILEEDVYLVTEVPKEQSKIKQVYCEDHKFNITFIMPLTSPALKVKEVEAVPNKVWLENEGSCLWIVGELDVSCSYVAKNHLIHQDFERLNFRFKIPFAEEIDQNNIFVEARPIKIMSNPEVEVVEVDLEVEVRTFHLAKI